MVYVFTVYLTFTFISHNCYFISQCDYISQYEIENCDSFSHLQLYCISCIDLKSCNCIFIIHNVIISRNVTSYLTNFNECNFTVYLAM